MKLLKTYKNLGAARHAAEILKEKGVLVNLTGEHLASTPTPYSSAIVELQLWAMLDYQYEDALLVLQDPDHQVADKLTTSELNDAEQMSKRIMADAINKILNNFLNILLGVIMLMIVSYVLYHIM